MKFGAPLHPDELPPHNLPGAVASQIEVLLLSLANIHKVGMDGATKEFLMDLMATKLTPDQRAGRVSIYLDASVVTQAESLVKDAFGFDRPRNIYDASYDPAKEGRLGAGKDEDGIGSLVNLDAFGRTRRDRAAGGRVNDDGRMSSTGYAGLSGTTWKPESGISGLTAQNFDSSPFKVAGLDLATTQYLSRQGFTQTQILGAAQDAKILGLNPTDRAIAKDLATIEKGDKKAKEFVSKTKKLKDRLADDETYQELLDQRKETSDPAEQKRLDDAIKKREAELKKESGVTDHIANVKDPIVKKAEERVVDEVVQDARDANKELRAKVGLDNARDWSQLQTDAKADTADKGRPLDTTRKSKDKAARADVAIDLGADLGVESKPEELNVKPDAAVQVAAINLKKNPKPLF